MKRELRKLSIEDVIKRRELHELSKITEISKSVIYQGVTFTLVIAKVTLGRKEFIGEGISRKSLGCNELYREITGYNEALSRALEALDKKLRRSNGYIGHKYEG